MRLRIIALFALLVCSGAASWNSDIDYLATELPKRHPNLFHTAAPSAFNGALDALKKDAASMSRAGFAIRLQEAVALLQDAHTEVDTRTAPMNFYPLRLYRFADGMYVTRTNDESLPACGARLVAINGVPVDDVYARVSSVVSAENDAWLSARVPVQMVRAEVLAAVGVMEGTRTAAFEFESAPGARFELTLHAISGDAAGDVLDRPFAGAGLPLYLQQSWKNYWYVWDADHKLLYLKYNVCADDPAKSFQAVAREMGAIVASEDVETFVIDLRNNHGGSDAVLRPLIDALPSMPKLGGRVFAIIGRETFSSGMLNAVQLRDAGAVLVGEPTGGKPNSYGEVKSMQLPASGLPVYYSTKFIHATDVESASLEPSIRVELTSDDFFSRRDPVLQAILDRGVLKPESAASGRRRAVRPAMRTCPE